MTSEVTGIIDRQVPQPAHHLPSVGTTLLLGALNRAIQPRSKRGWANWAAGTSLPRLLPGLEPGALTFQFFWDQMNSVSLEALRAIESDLVQAVIRELKISLDLLFYDTTNFFTYIASDNARAQLPQRGKNQQRRTDLRQFGLALLVARDGQIPLCSQVYEGRTIDCKLFPDALSRIRQRLAEITSDASTITGVYDKGHPAKAIQDHLQGQHIAEVLRIQFHADRKGADRLEYPVDEVVLAHLHEQVFGKRILITSRSGWSTEGIILAYRGQSQVEATFRPCQDDEHLAVRPPRRQAEDHLATGGNEPGGTPVVRGLRAAQSPLWVYLPYSLKCKYNAG